jgi:hypothetical protein
MSTTFCVVCACTGETSAIRKRKPAIQYLAMLRIDDLLGGTALSRFAADLHNRALFP